METPIWRKRVAIIMALVGFTLVVASLSFTAGRQVAHRSNNSVASSIPLADTLDGLSNAAPAAQAPAGIEKDFAVFWDVWSILERDFSGDIDQQAMIEGAIRGMVDSLGDPYTQYVDAQHNAIMRADDSGEFEGIGAQVDVVDGLLTIVSLFEDSPAARSGLKPGDVILAVDGQSVRGLDQMEAVSLVRGPRGSAVRLTIQREGISEPFAISIIRDTIPLLTVHSRLLADQIGYVSVEGFGARTVEELDQNLNDLQAQGATRLILDLRGNPGGFLDAAVETVSRFVDSGPALWWEDADGTTHSMDVKPRSTFDGPMIVLIDEGSASASEIVAGALQDSGRATLVGTQSFGKGSVQNVHQLRNGGSVRVTTAHWLTRDKRAIDGTGLEPDLHVAQEEAQPDVDEQLNFARRLLTHRDVMLRQLLFK